MQFQTALKEKCCLPVPYLDVFQINILLIFSCSQNDSGIILEWSHICIFAALKESTFFDE